MGLLDDTPLQKLVVPGVTSLVAFLAFTSQWLFYHIEPGPLRKGDSYLFNASVISLLICYWRTCFTDPGRIPKDWHEMTIDIDSNSAQDASKTAAQSNKWCRRCETFKPPRAHHCKTCKRCVTKMDHHCVWTANCVSHITIPHFIRFLFYADVSMAFLQYFLFQRVAVLWEKRHLPSYLGPSVLQLAHLFILCATNSMVLFALVLLLGRTLWSLAVNTWTIEGWEIERHHTLLRRAKVLGGYLEGPDGRKVRIDHQEFPWDVGIWSNICQGMGSRNPLSWFWPFSRSPSIESGLSFEHNEIDDPSKPWPPPDPDRLFRAERKPLVGDGFTKAWDVDAFKQRQAADLTRYTDADGEFVLRRRPFHERLEKATRQKANQSYQDENALETDDGSDVEEVPRGRSHSDAGEEAWRNQEGERLADFGVDEVADFYDEDDVPLGELVRRRQEGEWRL
ncbi:uncharacterized protein MYCFIDRAFT_87412 [Pseudocercospora fijiensis CIRAD86]|uniref:Palmitoyltransferase PFA4 n=1 Tax=Pseudocercospora fijiensis (strain CIRAD86) TaxID=383855 RepID=M3AP40_PSEFD|nr:uncharacterized protein MYCFIDRAFT_87412 [Pseudocercospora fijiensis CIRAD86]EME79207.1 hypothetical protein MYCFIDRAFT_87412 [Pseudocercospora fijiensis CIRAD86]